MNMGNIVGGNSLEAGETQKKLSLPFDTKEIYSLLAQGNYIGHFEKKYLHLSKNNPYNITEGMIYSQHECALYRTYFGKKLTEHDSVDIHLPYGTPIYAPCDMYVMSSYESTCPINTKTQQRAHYKDGSLMKRGMGLFVQGYRPESEDFIQLGHLSKIDDHIPFVAPVTQPIGSIAGMYDWSPQGHNIPPSRIVGSPYYTYITRGTLLGYSGVSGLTMGYEEYQASHPRQVKKPKPHQYYDEPHLHCEIFKRNEAGKKYGWKQVTIKDEFGNYILDPILRDIVSS